MAELTVEEEMENLRATVLVLQELQQSEGWVQLVKLINGRRLGLRQSLFGVDSNGKGLDGLIELARTQSELAGIEFVINLPRFVIEENEMQLRAIIEDIQNENNDSTDFRTM